MARRVTFKAHGKRVSFTVKAKRKSRSKRKIPAGFKKYIAAAKALKKKSKGKASFTQYKRLMKSL